MTNLHRLSPVTLLLFSFYLASNLMITLVISVLSFYMTPLVNIIEILLSVLYILIIVLFFLELRKFNYKKTLLTLLFIGYLITNIYSVMYQTFFFYLFNWGIYSLDIQNIYEYIRSLGFLYTSFELLNFVILLIGLTLIVKAIMPKLTVYGIIFLVFYLVGSITSRILLRLNLYGANISMIALFFIILITSSISFVMAYLWYKGDYTYKNQLL
ncbi:MAG: hypothetical protein ACOCUE_00225 [Candidatus Izemoplasmataceae bacterium]